MRFDRGSVQEGPEPDGEDTEGDGMDSTQLNVHELLADAGWLLVVKDWHDALSLNERLKGSDAIAIPIGANIRGYAFEHCLVLTDPFEDADYVWLREILEPALPAVDYWWKVAVEEYYESYSGNPPVTLKPEVYH